MWQIYAIIPPWHLACYLAIHSGHLKQVTGRLLHVTRLFVDQASRWGQSLCTFWPGPRAFPWAYWSPSIYLPSIKETALMLYDCTSHPIIICPPEVFQWEETENSIMSYSLFYCPSETYFIPLWFFCDHGYLKYVFNLRLGKVQKTVNIEVWEKIFRNDCCGLGWHLGT